VINHLVTMRQQGTTLSQEQFYFYLKSLLPSTIVKESTEQWWERISQPDKILEFLS